MRETGLALTCGFGQGSALNVHWTYIHYRGLQVLFHYM